MTKNKEDTIHGVTVYDIYIKNSSGKDSYLTQLAVNTLFVSRGDYQAISEGDGYQYFSDPKGTITLVSDKRTLILKVAGSIA